MIKKHFCTINPCYQCMPLGAVFAGFGFEKTLTLIHGSQGCATYMRRHIARHFHEPVDVASSSINEKDAIYGGEDNLKKAIKNVCKQYKPKMIVIASTCLSETIGDDMESIIKNFNEFDIPIVNVSTPSFKGSYSEGYWQTIKSMFKTNTIKNTNKKNFINIIPGLLTPQDLRYLKLIGDLWKIDFHIIGDYSETLDSGCNIKNHKLLPSGGTPFKYLKEASLAIATIEFSVTNSFECSPGVFLEQEFGVPVYRQAYPLGLAAVDNFMETLKTITGKKIPKSILTTRGRLLDAMMDAHKILFDKKVAIFGKSDFVYSAVKFQEELGLNTTVTVCEKSHQLLETNISKSITNGSMFELEEYLIANSVDLLLGSSVGSSLSYKLEIPLVRRGFPIHDRFGAGRILTIMYEGTISLLDDISNTLIEKQFSSFRTDLKKSYLNAGKDNL
ncbi:nitrogenase [Candidatus Poribacteria bacterium]|nr:nitrogenase [Candidatus Poribacteria bacterium]